MIELKPDEEVPVLLPITGFRGYWLSKNGGVYIKRKVGWARIETSVVAGKLRVSLKTRDRSGRTSRTIERLLAETWKDAAGSTGTLAVDTETVPIGFRRDPGHEDLVPDDAEQSMVDRVEELMDRGYRARGIVVMLNREGYRSRDGRSVPLMWVDQLVARVEEARRLARESVAEEPEGETSP